MNEYNVLQDIVIIKELLGFTKEGLANALGISRITLNNWMTGKNNISEQNMAASYSFAFKSGIRLSKIKEQLYKEDASEKSHILLFHGAKSKLEGELCPVNAGWMGPSPCCWPGRSLSRCGSAPSASAPTTMPSTSPSPTG